MADAQVNEANPTTNYGTLTQLLVDGGTDPDVASYLRFDVSRGERARAEGHAAAVGTGNGGTQDGPSVQTTGTSWSETGLTWNNRPAPSGGVLDDKGALSKAPGSSTPSPGR